MPIYQCVMPEGVLTADHQPEFARTLTCIHSETTGGPVEMVQVVFLVLPAGSAFCGGEPSLMSNITGYIQAGRSEAVRAELFRRINDAWRDATGLPDEWLKITLIDVPSWWIMQGGAMLPEPDRHEALASKLRDTRAVVARRIGEPVRG
jgi:phenylpyruvate tautomerase PptA (4-oxalocrotonate tautomerase family)